MHYLVKKQRGKLSLLLTLFMLVGLIIVPQHPVFAGTITYQAEDATISQGVTETINTGYTGASYVNYNNVTGSYVEWTVNASAAEDANLVFTFANGTTVDRPMEIKVNGTVVNSSMSFAPTGAFTTWNTAQLTVHLNAGSNTIRATATTANGGPNVDKLDVIDIPSNPGTYQAEDATIYQGITETLNSGYTGASYVNYNNVTGSYVEWTVNSPSAQYVNLVFRFANGTTVDRPMEIKVNGTVVKSSQSFAPTGAFTTWNVVSVGANLNAGSNTIRATALTANGGPNVDKLDIVPGTQPTDPGTYQAENATISQGVTETLNAGYTGASYVNYNNVAGSYVEWTVNVPAACTSSLEFTYANGTTANQPMDIAVNGTVVKSGQAFNPTSNYTTWRIAVVNVSLNAGNNTIRATATTANGGPNVDKLDVYTSTPTFYKFDFGNGAQVAGYTKVSATQAYSPSLKYGFNTPSNMANVTASGSGTNADAVQFLSTDATNTFNVDLPNGLYQMTVVLGNTSRSSVAAEGVYQIMNMTGNLCAETIQIPITDGQLNVSVTAGMSGAPYTLAALGISRISASTTMNRTIWTGGDSTACNYYPLATSVQTGWGQMLPSYINNITYQFRNIATAGQCARGFRDGGQFATIMKYIKPGDLFLLEFGINDTAAKNNETEDQFKEIMRDMVQQVKAKGATIVLVTPQGKATDWVNGVHTAVDKWYRHSTVALASEENVPLVDLNVLSSAYFNSIGQTATTALYMSDSLHFNHEGATQLARIVTEELTRQGLL